MGNMTLAELRTSRRAQILSLAEGNGARNVRVFGSVARGENDSQSDIDFLVDLDQGRSLLDLGRLQRGLETLLNQKVDVVSARGLREQVQQHVLRDAVPI
jgi:uncharacterized protein